MSDIAERLKSLTPEQQKLLKMKLKGKTKAKVAASPAARRDNKTRKMDFSIYFFSDDGTGVSGNKYQLLLDSARFADKHGLKAVWTPERHFQTFGGLYPNPSVTSAAVAAITQNLRIRCGSVVVPLHHPVRIAEEWGVVDNLSNGRVDISFATGWHRHDYLIRPQNFADRRKIMFNDIETIRALWRGEEVSFEGVDGEVTTVRSFPRPIQPELPFWITVASPGSFLNSGRMGANVLTMMGGTVDDLAQNVAKYRTARTENGHDPRKGVMTLMLHTYLDDVEEQAREKSREPMYRYLSNYLKQFASLPGAPKVDNTQDMLAFAFERYFSSSSLLGTMDKVRPFVSALCDIGVNEIACLIDFGVDGASVMKSLEKLARLQEEFRG